MLEFFMGILFSGFIIFLATLNSYEAYVINKCIENGEVVMHPVTITCNVKVNTNE